MTYVLTYRSYAPDYTPPPPHTHTWVYLREYIFWKLLLAWKFSCINKNCFFVKETETFGHIVVWTTYVSHIDHFTPKHAAFSNRQHAYQSF